MLLFLQGISFARGGGKGEVGLNEGGRPYIYIHVVEQLYMLLKNESCLDEIETGKCWRKT